MVDENGDVHLEKIHTHVDKWDEEIRLIAKNILSQCTHPVGDNLCEKAFWFHKCWKTADPKVLVIERKRFSFLNFDFNFFILFSALFPCLKMSNWL